MKKDDLPVQANTWTVEEIDLGTDIADLKKLTSAEQHLIKRLVAFFATGDSVVANNVVSVLYSESIKVAMARFEIATMLKI